MTDSPSIPSPALRRGWLLVLFATLCCKVVLLWGGGSRFAPDEYRYDHAIAFAHALTHAEFSDAAAVISAEPEHAGFTVLMLPAVLIQATLDPLTGRSPYENDLPPLLLLSACSIASLFLLRAIALRLGLTPGQALLAAALLAASLSWQRYSRHLLPYDLSLFLLLAGCWIRLRAGKGSTLMAGALLSLAFLTYNGYWTAVGVLGAALFFYRPGTTPKAWGMHALQLGTGFLAPVLLLNAFTLLGDQTMLAGLGSFSNTVNQGDWQDGGLIPFWYAWASDRGLVVVWLAWVGSLVVRVVRRSPIHRVEWACAGLAFSLWGLWALGSHVFEKFVVYGRLTRPALPLLALGTATWLGPHLIAAKRPALPGATAGILLLIACINWWPAFRMAYPRDALDRLVSTRQSFRVDLTYTGPGLHAPEEWTDPGAPHVFYNHRFLYPVNAWNPLPPNPGTLLWSAPHPAAAPWMQYNGYTRRERTLLREHPPQMMLFYRGEESP